MKRLAHILIFLLQLLGVCMVGHGLDMIWEPLGWIYAGIAAFLYGRVTYLAIESEETDK